MLSVWSRSQTVNTSGQFLSAQMDTKDNLTKRKGDGPARTIKKQLIELLSRDEEQLCAGWMRRLSEDAVLASINLVEAPREPLNLLLRDVVRIIEGKLPAQPPASQSLCRLGPMSAWKLTLCQGIEVFLVGESVVRRWVHSHLEAAPEEWFDVFEQLNRAFHQIVRYYVLRYCDSCVPNIKGEAQSPARGVSDPLASREASRPKASPPQG